jgi:hypothetical protein
MVCEKASKISEHSERKLCENPGTLILDAIIRPSSVNSASGFDPSQFNGPVAALARRLQFRWQRCTSTFLLIVIE